MDVDQPAPAATPEAAAAASQPPKKKGVKIPFRTTYRSLEKPILEVSVVR